MKTMTQSSPRVAIEPYKVYRDAFLRGPAGVRFKTSRKCIGKFTISRVGTEELDGASHREQRASALINLGKQNAPSRSS